MRVHSTPAAHDSTLLPCSQHRPGGSNLRTTFLTDCSLCRQPQPVQTIGEDKQYPGEAWSNEPPTKNALQLSEHSQQRVVKTFYMPQALDMLGMEFC